MSTKRRAPRAPRLPRIDPAELAELVREHRRTGTVPELLGAHFLTIGRGLWERFHFTSSADDCTQDIACHFLGQPLAKADPERMNLFSYFFTCGYYFGLKLRKRAEDERRGHAAYVDHVRDQAEVRVEQQLAAEQLAELLAEVGTVFEPSAA